MLFSVLCNNNTSTSFVTLYVLYFYFMYTGLQKKAGAELAIDGTIITYFFILWKFNYLFYLTKVIVSKNLKFRVKMSPSPNWPPKWQNDNFDNAKYETRWILKLMLLMTIPSTINKDCKLGNCPKKGNICLLNEIKWYFSEIITDSYKFSIESNILLSQCLSNH